MMSGRRRRLMADGVPAIEAAGILRLLVEKDVCSRGEAAACLRGMANDLVAYGYRSALGEAGRAYATALLERADELAAAERRREPGPATLPAPDGANPGRPRLVWRS